MSKESEAVKYQKLALISQLDQAKKEQRMNFNLARQNLRTTKAKMKSAKSALKAATSTYTVLKQKFEVGLVDDIAFLDALATKTLAEARYKETVYDYEVKKIDLLLLCRERPEGVYTMTSIKIQYREALHAES